MRTCQKCGHESDKPFCGNCGAPMVSDDPTRTSASAAAHQEGWHDDATSTGYVSPLSRPVPPTNSYSPGLGYGSTPVAAPPPRSGRGNQVLAALVVLVAVAVVALGGYLFMHKDNSSTNTAPSSSNGTVAPSSGSPSSSTGSTAQPSRSTQTITSTQAGNVQVAPVPPAATVTTTAQASAAPSAASSAGTALTDVPGYVNSSGAYAIGRQGNTLTVYQDSGSGAQIINSLVLKGAGDNSDLTFGQLSGCRAPIIVWNSRSDNSSAAFGMDANGQYQMFKAISGEYDMGPIGGSGGGADTMGVHLRNGYLAYNSTTNAYDTGQSDIFDSCKADGLTLNWVRQGE